METHLAFESWRWCVNFRR